MELLPPSIRFAAALLGELRRLGVVHLFLSPGSRSAPLALGTAGLGLQVHTFHDERVAAFAALGAAKAMGEPVALVCTSGSAVANWLPAVTESDASGLPLLLLSADRPPELRDRGASQTMPQTGIFAPFVRWSGEALTPADGGPDLVTEAILLARQALTAALGPRPGPVHLNLPFREPLYPDGGLAALEASLPLELPPALPLFAVRATLAPASLAAACELLQQARSVAIVAGPGELAPGEAEALLELSERLAAPVFAEGASGLRAYPGVIGCYEAALRSDWWDEFRPDLVLRLGEEPTSKALRSWIGTSRTTHLTLGHHRWHHPFATGVIPLAATPSELRDALLLRPPLAAPLRAYRDELRARLRGDSAALAAALDASESEGALPAEPEALRTLLGALGGDHLLHVASSMPIRDLDLCAPQTPAGLRITCNRGLNGIDGTVSTAHGLALALPERRVVALLGDVATLHDAGGLIALANSSARLTVVVINNDGGGIFGFLPSSRFGQAYRDHFATPHGLDFAHLAAQSKLAHRRVTTAAELAAAMADQQVGSPSALIEVVVSAEANRAAYAGLWPRLTDALAARAARPISGRRPAAHSAAHSIVTLHGFAGDAEDFGPLFAAATGPLASAAVEPVPMREGNTVRPLEQLVAHAGTALTEGQGASVLLGYSMGGRLALHAAFAQPPAALLLIGAAPALDDAFTQEMEPRAARANADAVLAARIRALGTAPFAAEWQQLPIIASQQAAPRWWQARRLARTEPALAEVWASSLESYGPAAMPSDWSRLAELRCPVCLVVGEHDAKYLAQNRELLRLLPNADLHIIPGAGHAPHLEQPTATAAVLSDFLARHLPTTHRTSQHA